MNHVFDKLLDSAYVEPFKIESQDHSDEDLSNVVAKGIKSCSYFIVIITEHSYRTLWINQEIGFAYAIPKLKGKRFTFIQSKIIGKLKGFVHGHKQFPYSFALDDDSSLRETLDKMVIGLEQRVIKEYKINMMHSE